MFIKKIYRCVRDTLLLRHIMVTLLAVCIVGFFAAIALLAKPLNPIQRAVKDFSFTDIYYEILNETGDPEECPFITIVDLTSLTNRADIAQTFHDIESCEPKVIGLDCVFDNEGEDFEGNEAIIEVASQYDNIIFALKALDYENDSIGHTKCIHSFFQEFVDIKEGTVNMPRGKYDSMKRDVPRGEIINGKWHPSFCMQVCQLYAGKDFAKGKKEDIKINFSPTKFVKLAPEDVKKHPELIRDRIVLFGCLYEDSDWHWTPADKIAGIELLAYATQTIITSREVNELPVYVFTGISLLLVLLVQFLQAYYLKITAASSNMFVKYLMGSPYFLGIITALFTFLFIGVTFFIFKLYSISFNLAWAMSVIAFLGTARLMYNALKDYFGTLPSRFDWLKKLFV